MVDDLSIAATIVFTIAGIVTAIYLLTVLGATVARYDCVGGETFRIDGTHYECVEVYKDKKGE